VVPQTWPPSGVMTLPATRFKSLTGDRVQAADLFDLGGE
jgi:hypothetical protein